MTVRFITRIPVIHGCRATSKNAASTSWRRSGISSISRDKAEENSMRSSSIRRMPSGLIAWRRESSFAPIAKVAMLQPQDKSQDYYQDRQKRDCEKAETK